MKRVTAAYAGDGAGGLAGVRQRSAARSRPLWIAELGFLQPGCGLEQPEMRVPTRCQPDEHTDAKNDSERSHVSIPFHSIHLDPLQAIEERRIDTHREMAHELITGAHDQPARAGCRQGKL